MLQKGKMILKKNCCQIVQTVIKECYHIGWSVEKIQKGKTQKL